MYARRRGGVYVCTYTLSSAPVLVPSSSSFPQLITLLTFMVVLWTASHPDDPSPHNDKYDTYTGSEAGNNHLYSLHIGRGGEVFRVGRLVDFCFVDSGERGLGR